MLDTNDHTVLVDLGLAIRLPVPEQGTALTATTTYQSFLQVGVLGYMAPEVHRKRAQPQPPNPNPYPYPNPDPDPNPNLTRCTASVPTARRWTSSHSAWCAAG